MSLNLEGKKEVVAEVSERLKKAQTVVLAEYRGLPVEDITVLRSQARASGVYLRVLKNTLARRAVQGTPFEKLADQMAGPLAYGISDDPVGAAKVLSAYAKGNDKLVIKGGAYAGKALNADGVKALAAIPSKEVLLSQIAGLLMSPVQRMAAVVAALAQKKGGGAEAAVPADGAAEAPAA